MGISWNEDWAELEKRLGDVDLETFINEEVIRPLGNLKSSPETGDGFPKLFARPIMIGFGVFLVSFMVIASQMPRTALGGVLSFLLFPTLFIGIMALTAYLQRGKIIEIVTKAENNFLIRSQCLSRIAARFDLDYIPVPGGASRGLKLIVNWKHCPKKVRDIVALMDAHSGLEVHSDAIRSSGLAMPAEYVLGSDDVKVKAYKKAQEDLQFEDGFVGRRNGVDFAVMEWEERNDDTSYHHLLIHMRLPHKLIGWVEFKNKEASWPQSRPNVDLKKVSVSYSPFAKAYSVRASDQTEAHLVFDPVVIEALARFVAEDPVRGVAFDEHLVLDIRGENRFELVNVATGQWSDERILKTFEDIAQMLGLVESIAKVFALKVRREVPATS